MAYQEPNYLEVNVTLSDISSSSVGSATNSLATALKRLRNNGQLPGVETQNDKDICSVIYSEVNPRINNGQVISVVDTYVCSAVYSTDINSTLIITLESLGIKPTSAYTATLTKS